MSWESQRPSCSVLGTFSSVLRAEVNAWIKQRLSQVPVWGDFEDNGVQMKPKKCMWGHKRTSVLHGPRELEKSLTLSAYLNSYHTVLQIQNVAALPFSRVLKQNQNREQTFGAAPRPVKGLSTHPLSRWHPCLNPQHCLRNSSRWVLDTSPCEFQEVFVRQNLIKLTAFNTSNVCVGHFIMENGPKDRKSRHSPHTLKSTL